MGFDVSVEAADAVKKALISAVVFLAVAGGAAAAERGPNVFEASGELAPDGQIDKIVFAKLASLKIEPALCSDAVFVRRAYLDIIGTVPTAKEAKEFIEDPDTKNKRRLLVDRLLEREEYADYWAMRWGDILRIKAEFPVNLWPNAAQAFHRWVRASLVENKPYDQFVNEMLTSSGSNFRVGPVNFYRAIQNRTPDGIAGAVALTFMGTRTDNWPTNKIEGMAVFFSQISYKPTSEWKEEHVFWNPLGSNVVTASSVPGKPSITSIAQPTNAVAQVFDPTEANLKPLVGVFPDGTKVKLSPNKDPREVFADWLVTPKNPWFTRCIVNRVWGWVMGRGIVHEPDDFRDDNPPSNPALLAYLEKELIAAKYDLKKLYRLILNSKTYQLSSMPKVTTPEAEANFASYSLRRLDAEVLIDAINKITGATDLYTSPIPEPFTYIPENKPAVAIADGSITSPFLTLFGRTARATGMENERNNKPVPSQWLHMLNSSHIYRKINEGAKMRAIIDSGRKPQEIIEELYLTILSRLPTADEVKNLEEYGTTQTVRQPPIMKNGKSVKQPDKTILVKRRDDWVDIAWALLNSAEFLYRH
ncbi:MAG: DUF1553 domain-containing protein [Verrucomicrobia bacterium]|nr:DUF1553 domain-containing protein [Verrucomicrobiota bacterium]